MNKDKLIIDLEKIIESNPHTIGRYGTKYFLFSESEIQGIIDLLKILNAK